MHEYNIIEVGGKNHSEGREGKILKAYTGLGVVPVPTSQSGKPHNSQGISRVLTGFAFEVGKISPRLNAILVLPIKTSV